MSLCTVAFLHVLRKIVTKLCYSSSNILAFVFMMTNQDIS